MFVRDPYSSLMTKPRHFWGFLSWNLNPMKSPLQVQWVFLFSEWIALRYQTFTTVRIYNPIFSISTFGKYFLKVFEVCQMYTTLCLTSADRVRLLSLKRLCSLSITSALLFVMEDSQNPICSIWIKFCLWIEPLWLSCFVGLNWFYLSVKNVCQVDKRLKPVNVLKIWS